MDSVKLRTVAFPDAGSHSAKLEFTTSNKAGTAQVMISVELRVKDKSDALSTALKVMVDDADVVTEGRRKLHEFATLLAEQTKEWAAP